MLKPSIVSLALGVLAATGWGMRAEQPAPAGPSLTKPEEKPKLKDPVVTTHEVTIAGNKIPYTATAGFLRLQTYEGKDRADIFHIAYTRGAGAPDPKRPIVFAFNGGPGSSSVWLHLGALGPRRVRMGPEGEPIGPPYELVDNADSWLDVADLVFIDPVSTGFSRAVEGQDPKQFHGLEEDAAAVADFIRLYTTKNNRWLSPKFLCGESYGTTRAAALSAVLQDTHGMYLNGIILVSPVLNFQTLDFANGNDTAYWLYLPAFTATAWYHGKIGGDLESALARSEAYAREKYIVSLAKGDDQSPEAKAATAREVASLIGVSPEFVARTRNRVDIGAFTKELLRDQGRTVGRLDARYRGIDRDDAGRGFEYDPSYAAIVGPYTAAINEYLRVDLKFESDAAYEVLTGRVHPWSFAGAQNEYVNVGERLRGAMTRNPGLKVFVASGYYDLATPYFAARYTLDHLGLDATLQGNAQIRYYRSGHMMYVRDEDRAALKRDVAGFMAEAAAPRAREGVLPKPR